MRKMEELFNSEQYETSTDRSLHYHTRRSKFTR